MLIEYEKRYRTNGKNLLILVDFEIFRGVSILFINFNTFYILSYIDISLTRFLARLIIIF